MNKIIESLIPNQLLSDLGKRFWLVFWFSSLTAISLFVIDFRFLRDNCSLEDAVKISKILNVEQNEDNYKQEEIKNSCLHSAILSNIYNSLLVSLITLVFIELTLHPDSKKEIKNLLENIKDLFNESRPTKAIKSLHLTREDYRTTIVKKITNLQGRERIKLLGSIEDLNWISSIDSQIILEKIEKGCDFKIILLDPTVDNKMLDCLKNSHSSCNNKTRKYIVQEIQTIFAPILNKLKTRPGNYPGSIELKLQRSIYSSICYFSIINSNHSEDDISLIWTYIFNQDDILYPSVQVTNEGVKLFKYAEQHFRYLWSHTYNYQSVLKHRYKSLVKNELENRMKLNNAYNNMTEDQLLIAENKVEKVIEFLYKNLKEEEQKKSDLATIYIKEYFSGTVYRKIENFCTQQQNNTEE